MSHEELKLHNPASVGLKIGKIVMASPEELDLLDVDKSKENFSWNSKNLTLKGKINCRKTIKIKLEVLDEPEAS